MLSFFWELPPGITIWAAKKLPMQVLAALVVISLPFKKCVSIQSIESSTRFMYTYTTRPLLILCIKREVISRNRNKVVSVV